MRLKQIVFIYGKYRNLVIVHLKQTQFINTFTEIIPVSLCMPDKYVSEKFLHAKTVIQINENIICNSNT